MVKPQRKTIDDYRRKFKTAPLGIWSHAVGTFGGVMNEVWTFNPDHTGKVVEYGPFGHRCGEMLFEWKEVDDFIIACRVTKWPEYIDQCGDEDTEEEPDDEGEEWDTIHYDFKTVPTDCGDLIALCQVLSDGTWIKEFWQSLEPLAYDGHW